TSVFARRCARTSSSARALPSRTHGPRPTPTCTPSGKCRAGNGPPKIIDARARSSERRGEMNAQESLVTGTDFVFLPITSFERAEQFYSGVLGLECSKRYDDGLGGEFETGSL